MKLQIISLKDKFGKSKIPLKKSRLFWAGVLIKLVLSCLFASAYLKDQFAPFADYFIGHSFANPYEYFSQHGTGTEFPYPPAMLYIFSLPRLLLWPFTGHDTFGIAASLIYRIPLFVADFTILIILMRWMKSRTRQVLIWYWLSPVLIYINYFHGQLDVIPIALLFVSLYFLFKSRWMFTFVFLAVAICCKTNIALVIPFYVIYLFRTPQVKFKNIPIALGTLIAIVLLINLPWAGSKGFVNMVYNNPVQQQIFDLFYQFNTTLKIYFIPAVYFVLVIWYASLRFVNKDQLILFLTFCFLALTLLVAPMQGWYYWIYPFIGYFVIKQGLRERQVFIILTLFYFAYFALAANSDYFNAFNLGERSGLTFCKLTGIEGDKLLNIVFTLLQTTLFLVGFLVFRKGISNNIQTKFLSQPYLIGIGGDSAAGKSTLTGALSAVFENNNTSIIRGDDMHKWERGNENWKEFTHLDPRANKLHEELVQSLKLKTGESVHRRFYDHGSGLFTLPNFIKANRLIIFEGLHSFYLKDQSDIYDLKIFMEPDEQLRIWWKVQRDVKKRNYTPQQVLEQLQKREEDSVKYIQSQRSKADIIASFFSLDKLDINNTETEPRLGIKLTVPDNISFDLLLHELKRVSQIEIEHHFTENKQEIKMTGSVNPADLEIIAYELLPEMEEIGIYSPEWKEGYEGLLQLMTMYTVINKLKYETHG